MRNEITASIIVVLFLMVLGVFLTSGILYLGLSLASSIFGFAMISYAKVLGVSVVVILLKTLL